MSHTLVSLWTEVRRRLEAAGVDTPVFDARLLLEAGAGVSRLDILTDPRRPLSEAQVEAVQALAARRERREPVAYILGRKSFWTLDLAVSDAVLVPRPETELLVETALAAIPEAARARVLDLGVGSGAILLAILRERPNATGVGVDVSADALAVARGNARALSLESRADFRQGDWWSDLDESFDVIVSNPPYIAKAELEALAPEVVRYEPMLALDGGEDGLDAYRSIVAGLGARLRASGVFAFEVGHRQANAVRQLAALAGFEVDEPLVDIAGAERVVRGRHRAEKPLGSQGERH